MFFKKEKSRALPAAAAAAGALLFCLTSCCLSFIRMCEFCGTQPCAADIFCTAAENSLLMLAALLLAANWMLELCRPDMRAAVVLRCRSRRRLFFRQAGRIGTAAASVTIVWFGITALFAAGMEPRVNWDQYNSAFYWNTQQLRHESIGHVMLLFVVNVFFTCWTSGLLALAGLWIFRRRWMALLPPAVLMALGAGREQQLWLYYDRFSLAQEQWTIYVRPEQILAGQAVVLAVLLAAGGLLCEKKDFLAEN